jgi:glutamine synthetase
VIYKYIWLDGYTPEQNLRSKIQVAEGYGILSENDGPPIWSFDGSSTQQAEGGESDCVLKPVSDYRMSFDSGSVDTLVMCEVLNSDHSPHKSNNRTECEAFVGDEWWFGFEQEYFFYQDGEPLGWKKVKNQLHKDNTIVV